MKDGLSGMMGEQVEELLRREENKGLFDNLEKASQRVEIAKTQLAFIQKQELALKQYKDYIQQLEGNAFQVRFGVINKIKYFYLSTKKTLIASLVSLLIKIVGV